MTFNDKGSIYDGPIYEDSVFYGDRVTASAEKGKFFAIESVDDEILK